LLFRRLGTDSASGYVGHQYQGGNRRSPVGEDKAANHHPIAVAMSDLHQNSPAWGRCGDFNDAP
jgi:hypothetical protein